MTAKTLTDDRNRVGADPLALAIFDSINALPHATRLYPDVYAEKVAEAVRAHLATLNARRA